MSIEHDLLTVRRGCVTAPAGCGKTHAIASALRQYEGTLPVLVLTHTNAGVNALRRRLRDQGVPPRAYRVSTIDGFAKRLAAMFPRHSGIKPQTLELARPGIDYKAIRYCAATLLEGRHLDDVLPATYTRLLVDEYQDCSQPQHRIVQALAKTLPACVLGDPMQAIFGFAEPMVDWHADVLSTFPSIGELDTPWRWINAGAKGLGRWLMSARATLEAHGQVDISALPSHIEYVPNPRGLGEPRRSAAMRTRASTSQGQVLVIGDSSNVAGRHNLARQIPGATIVESVDLKELTRFSRHFDLHANNATIELLRFTATLMAGLDRAATERRIATLQNGRGTKPPSPVESALLNFDAARTFRTAHIAVTCMKSQHGVRIFRPDVLHHLVRALESAANGQSTFHEAAIRERERFRHRGRPLHQKNVGSTLLLKGLEAEVVVILQPEKMDAHNLYVALTRASRKLVVCARSPLLP